MCVLSKSGLLKSAAARFPRVIASSEAQSLIVQNKNKLAPSEQRIDQSAQLEAAVAATLLGKAT